MLKSAPSSIIRPVSVSSPPTVLAESESGYLSETGSKTTKPNSAPLLGVNTEKTQKTQIFCRVRARSPTDNSLPRWLKLEGTTLTASEDVQLSTRTYAKPTVVPFDKVILPGAAQQEVFNVSAKPLLERVLDDHLPAALLAYGQSGSGKTYTICGDAATDETAKIPGLMDMIVRHILESKNLVSLELSATEIYNAGAYDASKALSSREPLVEKLDLVNGTDYVGLKKYPITSMAKFYRVFEVVSENRRITSTRWNDRSTRSNLIITLRVTTYVDRENNERIEYVAPFYVVDLCGSERMTQAGTDESKTKMAETIAINTDLSSLSGCLYNLAMGELVVVRANKLTSALASVLVGNALIALMIHVRCDDEGTQSTVQTMRFANRCSAIRTTPTAKKILTYEQLALELERVLQENKRLKAENARLKSGKRGASDSLSDDLTSTDSATTDIGSQAEEDLLEHENQALRKELDTLTTEYKTSLNKIDELTDELETANTSALDMSIERDTAKSEADALRKERDALFADSLNRVQQMTQEERGPQRMQEMTEELRQMTSRNTDLVAQVASLTATVLSLEEQLKHQGKQRANARAPVPATRPPPVPTPKLNAASAKSIAANGPSVQKEASDGSTMTDEDDDSKPIRSFTTFGLDNPSDSKSSGGKRTSQKPFFVAPVTATTTSAAVTMASPSVTTATKAKPNQTEAKSPIQMQSTWTKSIAPGFISSIRTPNSVLDKKEISAIARQQARSGTMSEEYTKLLTAYARRVTLLNDAMKQLRLLREADAKK